MMAGEWERGLKRAYLVEFADGDEHKIAAAEFYAAYAGHLCETGQIERGKFYVGEAAKVFPGIRMQILEARRSRRFSAAAIFDNAPVGHPRIRASHAAVVLVCRRGGVPNKLLFRCCCAPLRAGETRLNNSHNAAVSGRGALLRS